MNQNFLEGFHAVTEICIPISIFIIIIAIFFLILILKKGKNYFKDFCKSFYTVFEWRFIIIIVFAGLIMVNSLCYFIFRGNDMDALYENKEYTQNYEAYLYENEDSDPLFCIVEIAHSDSSYTITKIHYSKGVDETEIEYNPKEEFHAVSISEWDGLEFDLRRGRIADDDSFYRLSKENYDFAPYNFSDLETDLISRLDGYYECTDVHATALKDLPATEQNVFYTDNFTMDIRDGHFTCWDDSGDFSFGPTKVALDDSSYDYIVYSPSLDRIDGELVEKEVILAYIDIVDIDTFDFIYTEEGNNEYFMNISATFKKVQD